METAARKHPNYVAVWGGLFLLTVAEVLVAFASHIPRLWLILLLMALAVWKALLVALYFMHLKFESPRLRLLALSPFPLAAILILAVITEKIW